MILREKKQEERSDEIYGPARGKNRRCFYDIVGKRIDLKTGICYFFLAGI
jgi:hypothetical protein